MVGAQTEEYRRFNNVAKKIAQELERAGFEGSDLLFVDYSLYEVWKHTLGFDAEIEKLIGPGSRVDVVWRARIGNLVLLLMSLRLTRMAR